MALPPSVLETRKKTEKIPNGVKNINFHVRMGRQLKQFHSSAGSSPWGKSKYRRLSSGVRTTNESVGARGFLDIGVTPEGSEGARTLLPDTIVATIREDCADMAETKSLSGTLPTDSRVA